MNNDDYIKLMSDMVAIVKQAMLDVKKDILEEISKEAVQKSPKYNVGDMVYFSVRGCQRYGHIEEVSTYSALKGPKYVYIVNVFGSFYEHELFESPQDLARQQLRHWNEELAKYVK